MNELKQLKYTLPLIAKDRQYRELAQKIKNTVSEGRNRLTVVLDFELSDDAVEALDDADISVTKLRDESSQYLFKIGGQY